MGRRERRAGTERGREVGGVFGGRGERKRMEGVRMGEEMVGERRREKRRRKLGRRQKGGERREEMKGEKQ